MKRNLIIVDDFYPNFEEVRQIALAAEYPEPQQGFTYPGRNSAKRHLPESAITRIASLFGGAIWYEDRIATGFFRRTLEHDTQEQDIHIDSCGWSGVVYLNTPEQCAEQETTGGTTLWRHKETGMEIVPQERVSSDEGRQIVYRDGFDYSKWDKLTYVPCKSNRLVLFKGLHWHSAGRNFGNSIENCRLIHLYFFDEGIRPVEF